MKLIIYQNLLRLKPKRFKELALTKGLLLVVALLLVGSSYAQTVSGTVKDADGLEIIGANILIKGTSSGTVTEFDGSYTLDVANDATLVFSYLGYQTQEILVAGRSVIGQDQSQVLKVQISAALLLVIRLQLCKEKLQESS